jgi:Activator of Hsp90 ATPase homolog 1-like protein
MISPLQVDFVVACGRDTAFRLWTQALGTWWPADHTVSGDPVAVVMEGHVGGRVFERARDGTEHEWGRITLWEPPSRLGYTWHLGSDPDDATDVLVGFLAGEADDTTVVKIEHSGWERLGDRASSWQDRNRAGWESLLPYLAQAASSATRTARDVRPNTERGLAR